MNVRYKNTVCSFALCVGVLEEICYSNLLGMINIMFLVIVK